ncbi:methyltransferase domain-containing protein [Penicillium herquei]|nr:methyltransferase domain-containing protein [Penicillium herquei]
MDSQHSSATVAALYDQLSGALMTILGGSIHFGYWDNAADERGIEAATDRMTTLVADRLAITSPKQRILDVGCGTGKPAMQIALTHNCHVTGITNSNRQVEIAQSQVPNSTEPGKLYFQLEDAEDLKFPDGSFDGAVAIESLIHMGDKRAAIAQIARVLRPGSRFVIADVFIDDGPIEDSDAQVLAGLCQLFQVRTIPTAGDFRELLQQTGLEIIEFTDVRQNVQRNFQTIASGLSQIEIPQNNEMGEQVQAMIKGLSKMGDLKQFGYAIITAVRKE